MRQFYLTFPIGAEPPHLLELQTIKNQFITELPHKWQRLSWTHWVELLKIDDPLERSFYMHQSIYENWSTPQLIHQKKSSLYLCLAASRDKKGILKLAREGNRIEKKGKK